MILEINTLSPVPIYEQLRNEVVLGIAAGKLAAGEALPSVRRMAADLGINFHTVNKGYAVLSDEGYIAMDRRKGAVIAAGHDDARDFRAALAEKLVLTAAEAVCHNMSESEFLAACAAGYKNALGVKTNGGAS